MKKPYPSKCTGCGEEFSGRGGYMNHARYSKTCSPEKRFWGKVQKGPGCWIWLGARSVSNYGTFNFKGHNINAHRAAWLFTHGPINEPGIDVLHTCHNGHLGCVRPDHLYLGTDIENTRDREATGTITWGEKTKRNKLKEADVHEIRRLKGAVHAADLADKYGVRNGAIEAIWKGRSWKRLPVQP